MAGLGNVYGKFISGEASLYQISQASGAPAIHGTHSPSSTTRFLVIGNGNTIASFSMGVGASIGSEQSDTPWISGLAILEGRETNLLLVLRSIEAYLFGNGFKAMLIHTEGALDPEAANRAGLYLIGIATKSHPLSFQPTQQQASVPERLKNALRRHFPGAVSLVYSLSTSLFPSRDYLTGRCDGKDMRAVLLGAHRLAGFYSGAFLKQGRRSGHMGQVDFEIAYQKASVASYQGESLIIPAFVRSILTLHKTFDEYIARLEWTARSDMNKLNRNGLIAETSKNPVEFAIFFHSMYLPTIMERHGRRSVKLEYHEIKHVFDRGFLLLVKKGSAPVSGCVLGVILGKRLLLKSLGVLGGSKSHTQDGAGAALYYYSIKHAYENGYGYVDFGYSAPFKDDGVLRYKQKWKASHVRDSGCDRLLVTFRDKQTKKEFLASMKPFLMDELPVFHGQESDCL